MMMQWVVKLSSFFVLFVVTFRCLSLRWIRMELIRVLFELGLVSSVMGWLVLIVGRLFI